MDTEQQSYQEKKEMKDLQKEEERSIRRRKQRIGQLRNIIVGVGVAFAQFDTFSPIAGVAAIFLIGQIVESYVLTPRLVGDKVGLHDLWIMFALMAGGSLFGFTGVLLAVPTAAVIGVLLRFAMAQYLDSALYHGHKKTGAGET